MNERLSDDLASLKIDRGQDRDPEAGSKWRIAVIVAVILAACVFGAWFFLTSLKGRLMAREVAVTQTRVISPAQSSVQVTSTGYVVAQTASKVGAKILGRVAEVTVKEASRVKEGDVLVRLDTAEQRASISAAKAKAAAARARAETARANVAETRRQYEREKGLLAEGAAARSVVEDLELRLTSLKETLNAAEADAKAEAANVQTLEASLEYATIEAPINGTVLGKPVEVGELVGPSTPPVVELADFSSLMVETDVPEGRMQLLKPGTPAEIVLDAYPSKRHRGEVAAFSPRVNRAKATVVVKVKFIDSPEGVLPDMAARVSFLSKALDAESMNAPPKLVVPSAALADRDGQKVVFLLEEGKARKMAVKLGPPMADGFEVIEGPREGAKLVANPPAELIDGQSVKEKAR